MMGSDWKWSVVALLCLSVIILWLLSREEGVSTSPMRWTTCLLLPTFISLYGMKKKSLDFSGGMLAILVGFILTTASACFCASLLVFFITSSRLTKWKGKEKQKIEGDYKEGGQRNWIQVLCNGGVSSVAALFYLHSAGMGERPITFRHQDPPSLYAIACLAALACSCGDTWASEVGSVLGGTPRLITTWRQVPRGTNGGVTGVGIVCSAAGGVAVGMAYIITLITLVDFDKFDTTWTSQLLIVIIGGIAGLFGSLVDSVLGATIQFTGYSTKLDQIVHSPAPGVRHVSGVDILDNHAVNLMSSLITALFIPVCISYYCNT